MLHQSGLRMSVVVVGKRSIEKTYTRATMLNRLVRNRKFSKVVADHLWLDFDGVEDLRKQAQILRIIPLLLEKGRGHTFPL